MANRALNGILVAALGSAALVGGVAMAQQAARPQAAPPAMGGGRYSSPIQPPSYYGANDPLFQQPYIDIDEWRDLPVRHHYIHGGFKGTDLKFSFYFPDKAQYHGRFFQALSANTPTTDSSASQARGPGSLIGFAIDSGGYLVESNMGGTTGRGDSTIGGFRGSAAAADYSRVVALKLFGGKRPYGYVYGGSGGAYRTFGCIENTLVWDGGVPIVPGSTHATGLIATGHERVGRELLDKMPQILDAVDAGGSGNPYAGLNKDQAEALHEMLRFGVPLNMFQVGKPDLAIGSSAGIPADPTYVNDFWTKPGYEGADPNSYAARHRIVFKTTVGRLLSADEAKARGLPPMAANRRLFVNPVGGQVAPPAAESGPPPTVYAVELASDPHKDLRGAVLKVKTGAAAGKIIPIERYIGGTVAPGSPVPMDPRIAAFSNASALVDAAFADLGMLKPGDEVEVDNSASLAADVYNRYATPKGDFLPWRQYKDAKGNPIFPQREKAASDLVGAGVGGSTPNGKFRVKVIMLASAWDELAAPWNADWYAHRVQEHWGPKLHDNYRIWYTDRATHGGSGEGGPDATKVVSYQGVVQQALRDLSAWVERGVAPPESTSYRFVDGQLVLAPTAALRHGVQPVIGLTANGKTRAVVKPGQQVTLTGTVDVPPGTGKVVQAEWDFDGSGKFAVPGTIKRISPTKAVVTITHSFDTPGTHFAVLRATSQRTGNGESPFARVRNLQRVRVVVG